jgi:hypothetical protein
VRDGDVVKAGGRECLVERGRDVGGTDGRTKPPGHDVAREVVEHRRQVVPAPASDLEVGEVRLPELIDGGGLVFGKDGLVDELKKALSERILNTELDEHLDAEKPRVNIITATAIRRSRC